MTCEQARAELEMFLQYRQHKNSTPYIEFHHSNSLNQALELAISKFDEELKVPVVNYQNLNLEGD